jgi:hypothetical protein
MKRETVSHFGPISETAGRAAMARAKVLAKAEAALARLAEGVFLGCFENVEFFVQPELEGYAYGFMRNAAGEWAPRVNCTGNWQYRADVIRSVISHIATNAWSIGMDDELAEKAHAYLLQWTGSFIAEAVRKELIEMFSWQRRYAAAIDGGAAPEVAHEIASGLRPAQPANISARGQI